MQHENSIKKEHRPSPLEKRQKLHPREMVRIWIAFLHQDECSYSIELSKSIRHFLFAKSGSHGLEDCASQNTAMIALQLFHAAATALHCISQIYGLNAARISWLAIKMPSICVTERRWAVFSFIGSWIVPEGIFHKKCKGPFCEKSPLHFFAFFIIKTERCNAGICSDKTSFGMERRTWNE